MYVMYDNEIEFVSEYFLIEIFEDDDGQLAKLLNENSKSTTISRWIITIHKIHTFEKS